MTTNFFLGANTRDGFRSLYGDFTAPDKNFDLMILKGGPGSGKSTFMKHIGRRAEEAGEDVEYIRCSGDPASLDAVRLPRAGIAIVDGTAPHAAEPQYPGAVDRYVNLGRFCHIPGCKAAREEILQRTADYKAAYAEAYRALRAAGEVADTLYRLQTEHADLEKLTRRTGGIIQRELARQNGNRPSVSRRFLGGITHLGPICRFDTVDTLASRVYALLDSSGISHHLLHLVCQAAEERGHDMILCPDPEHPERLRHLILPRLRLAFVTSTPEEPYPGTAYRRIHLDTLLDRDLCRKNKTRCRFHRRMHGLLLEEGRSCLARAKAAHDRLEAAYNPLVDFDGVCALAEEEWCRISHWL